MKREGDDMRPKLGVFSDRWTVQDVGVVLIDRANPKTSWSPCSMRVARVFFFAVISCSLSHGAFAQAAAQAREAPLSPQHLLKWYFHLNRRS
jgi:hypothetical protein